MKPLVNKTLQGNYSPGSTIKPIVALSALENGIINTNFTINCRGHKHPLELYGQTYHCWKKQGHGFMNLRNAMKQSCDIYFYEVARKLGVDKLSDTAKKFGLGKEVFGDLFSIEKKGLIPNTQWKKNALGQGWLLMMIMTELQLINLFRFIKIQKILKLSKMQCLLQQMK